MALGLALCSDATVSDDGAVIGDPTEAALVVLAAKMGVDAEQTRSALERRAEVPFDSEYKFMATFHDRPDWVAGGILTEPHFMTVKGAPDIVVDHCSQALWHGRQIPIDEARAEILAANQQLSEKGLRVLAFAARELDDDAMSAAIDDPMAAVARSRPRRARRNHRSAPQRGQGRRPHGARRGHRRANDHRRSHRHRPGDRGRARPRPRRPDRGQSCSGFPTRRWCSELPNLHVFGRVAPEDKLRLAKLMQQSGDVVAMTGDAVNDAAALKQADVGVAMGSGSEVSKQAAKIVLTDDNFATLVRAVDLGRDIYRRITSYVKLQLTILSSVLQLMVLATIFNINGGVALFPMQLLFCKFFVVVTVVIGFIVDVPDPGRDASARRASPARKIVNPPQVIRWVLSGSSSRSSRCSYSTPDPTSRARRTRRSR